MSNLEIFITNPFSISATSFYPRNYNPKYLFVKDGMKDNPTLLDYIEGGVTGGSGYRGCLLGCNRRRRF